MKCQAIQVANDSFGFPILQRHTGNLGIVITTFPATGFRDIGVTDDFGNLQPLNFPAIAASCSNGSES